MALRSRFERDWLHHLETRGRARPRWADAIEIIHVRVRVTASKQTTGPAGESMTRSPILNRGLHVGTTETFWYSPSSSAEGRATSAPARRTWRTSIPIPLSSRSIELRGRLVHATDYAVRIPAACKIPGSIRSNCYKAQVAGTSCLPRCLYASGPKAVALYRVPPGEEFAPARRLLPRDSH
jgi:hypothetical protein